jgi:hypothetical protein
MPSSGSIAWCFWALSLGSQGTGRAEDSAAGDSNPLASHGFRAYWRWKSGRRVGRPKTPRDIRKLILEMSGADPLWGPTRIHGELLRLGTDVPQTTVAKCMAKRRRPPSQGRKTFLRNHADGIASMDLFVVPTISFRLLYGLLVLRHSRRALLWLSVTVHRSSKPLPTSTMSDNRPRLGSSRRSESAIISSLQRDPANARKG